MEKQAFLDLLGRMKVGGPELGRPEDAKAIRAKVASLRPKTFRTKLSTQRKFLHVWRVS